MSRPDGWANAIDGRTLARAGAAAAMGAWRSAAWGVPRLVRFAYWLVRMFGRAAVWLARWSVRHPRAAVGAAAGTAAAAALVLAVRHETPVGVEMSDSLECLALNIYHEARGEPDEGKIAVAQVVMNRVADRRFPDDVCAVVKQGGTRLRHACQFSWWCDGRSDRPRDRPAWARSKTLARQILDRTVKDPTGGALWYHADYVSPRWDTTFAPAASIGRHIFYVPAAARSQ